MYKRQLLWRAYFYARVYGGYFFINTSQRQTAAANTRTSLLWRAYFYALSLIHICPDMLNMLRGMFAFAIWDSNKKELFAARDYFGIKPFYYTIIDGDIIYSSEIKSILKHPKYKKELNLDALESYLSFNYSVLEETFFKGIYKLWPAHYMTFKDGKVDIHRYWEPEFKSQPMSLEEAVDKIDDVMLDSIKAHMISDVEVGSFLSSGVDSSYVAACFKGDKTFTVGFDYDNYSEIEYAKELSDEVGIKNYGRLITTEEYWSSLPKVQYQMDEPLADASAVALYFLSQCASKQVKVCLSGEGCLLYTSRCV